MRRILFFLSIVLMIACSKKQPACASEVVKQQLLSAYKKDVQTYLAGKSAIIKSTYEKIFPVYTDSIVTSYFRNGMLTVENLKTVEQKPEENACSCKAKLTYSLSNDFVTTYKRNAALFTAEEYYLNPGFDATNVDVEVGYTVLVTDGKEQVQLEEIVTEDLYHSIEQFVFFYALNEMVLLKMQTAE